MTNFDTVREALNLAANTSAYMCIENAVARDACKDALSALAELERTHYTAEDVADASAQGFRAGVASVTAGQEPMFWVRLRSDGLYEGPIHNAQIERVRAQSGAWSPLFLGAAPVAQQPRQCGLCGSDEAFTGACGGGRSNPRALCYESGAQQPQARPDFTDEWAGYLKDGETPFERFLRERKDVQSALKLYQRALEENERLKAQQPQAEAVPSKPVGYVSALALRLFSGSATDHTIRLRHTPSGAEVIPIFTPAPQQAEAVPTVTPAMVDAYLKANDAYWKRTDDLPKSPAKWRNGTPAEATRESLIAALAAAPQPKEQSNAACRTDGRCQYAIDHDAEKLGHCPTGKCVMPRQAETALQPKGGV